MPQNATRHKESNCPYCDHPLDTSEVRSGQMLRPKPGDTTVCIGCARALFFAPDMSMRRPHPGELEQLMAEDPDFADDLANLQRSIRSIAPLSG
jgi:hypothetical protein